MAENKKISEIMKESLKNDLGLNEDNILKRASRIIGNNGRPINTELTLTGDITILDSKDSDGKITGKYFALTVKENGENPISLASLLGVSSLNGYLQKGEKLKIEIETKDKIEVEEVETTANISEYEPFSWITRNLFDCADYIAEHPELLKNKKIKYLGKAIKPFKAKKDFKFNGGKVKSGMQRAIETSLWNIGI